MHRRTRPAYSPSAVLHRLDARRRLVLLVAVVLVGAFGTIHAAVSLASPASGHRPSHQNKVNATVTHRWARQMLNLLNTERTAHGLAPLRARARLITSAHQHNRAMARADVMAHRLPGEPYFAQRISRAGYRWRAAGENIGWNADISKDGVLKLERVMYGEHSPSNGHRVNILNSNFTAVGIDVYYDRAHQRIWFTQDFGRR